MQKHAVSSAKDLDRHLREEAKQKAAEDLAHQSGLQNALRFWLQGPAGDEWETGWWFHYVSYVDFCLFSILPGCSMLLQSIKGKWSPQEGTIGNLSSLSIKLIQVPLAQFPPSAGWMDRKSWNIPWQTMGSQCLEGSILDPLRCQWKAGRIPLNIAGANCRRSENLRFMA